MAESTEVTRRAAGGWSRLRARMHRVLADARVRTFTITVGLAVLAGALRFAALGHSAHHDSFYWVRRTVRFWNGLSSGDWAATNQSAHPGVTLMWLGGASARALGLLGAPFSEAVLVAYEIPIALAGTLAAALTFPLLKSALGPRGARPALVLALLFLSEPYLLEQSRILHLDMLGGALLWLGLLVALLAYVRESWRLAALAGALLSAAALTRFSLVPIIVCALGSLAVTWPLRSFRDRRGLRVALAASATGLCWIFLTWPATWKGLGPLLNETLEATRSLVERGHDRGGVRDPSAWYYVQVIAGETPPETALLALVGIMVGFRLPDLRTPIAWLVTAVIPYAVLLALAPKKLDRYALPLFFAFVPCATLGLEWMLRALERRRVSPLWLAALVAAFFVPRYARAAASLPIADPCFDWPGVEELCSPRGADMYHYREIGIAISDDLRARRRRGRARVAISVPKLLHRRPLQPWLDINLVPPQRADYIVLWDRELERRRLKVERRLGEKSRPLHEVKVGDQLVALIYRVDE